MDSRGTTAFLGLSHLGIVSSAAWASLGRPTIGIDPDGALVERLNRVDLPVQEPGLEDLVRRASAWLRFSCDMRCLAECSVVIVSRDVPTDDRNASDVAYVTQLVDAAIPFLRPDAVFVVMSQVPPGFCRALEARMRGAGRGLEARVYYWVETLIFGDAVQRALKPERLIIGTPNPSDAIAPIFLHELERYHCPILVMGFESAELTKTAINLYLIGSVTFTNTLADLCEALGADWSEIAPALRLDRRIGPSAYLRPSLGIAGGNLERDLATLRSLAETRTVDGEYLDTLSSHNTRRFGWVERKLEQRGIFAAGRQPIVAIWGLTYKKNTHSTKNSPGLRLAERLGHRATVRAWDPVIDRQLPTWPLTLASDRDQAIEGADALVIMADWDDFACADIEAIRRLMRTPLVVDCAGVLDGRRREFGEVEYVSMGR